MFSRYRTRADRRRSCISSPRVFNILGRGQYSPDRHGWCGFCSSTGRCCVTHPCGTALKDHALLVAATKTARATYIEELGILFSAVKPGIYSHESTGADFAAEPCDVCKSLIAVDVWPIVCDSRSICIDFALQIICLRVVLFVETQYSTCLITSMFSKS